MLSKLRALRKRVFKCLVHEADGARVFDSVVAAVTSVDDAGRLGDG
jgi:hypothetical protein